MKISISGREVGGVLAILGAVVLLNALGRYWSGMGQLERIRETAIRVCRAQSQGENDWRRCRKTIRSRHDTCDEGLVSWGDLLLWKPYQHDPALADLDKRTYYVCLFHSFPNLSGSEHLPAELK